MQYACLEPLLASVLQGHQVGVSGHIRTLMQSNILTHLPSPLALPQYLCEESDPHSERFQFGFSPPEMFPDCGLTCAYLSSKIFEHAPTIEVQKHETDGTAVEMQTD